MNKLLLILSFTWVLASPAFALKKGERHPEPYKVMTKGQVIGQEIQRRGYSWLLVAYEGEMYACGMVEDEPIYGCVLLAPKIN